jgi:hypothetical protein
MSGSRRLGRERHDLRPQSHSSPAAIPIVIGRDRHHLLASSSRTATAALSSRGRGPQPARAAARLPRRRLVLVTHEPRPADEPPSPDGETVTNRFPLGHYYSPVPDDRELRQEPRRSQVWPARPPQSPGIDWRDDRQVALCREVFALQARLRFPDDAPEDPTVYFTNNGQYPALDAWILEGILRSASPKRMIEIGSGFSSLLTARVNREYLGGELRFICIEPYPRQFLSDGVEGITSLLVEQVQDVPLEVYLLLGDGDVLFVDSSHTVKTGGDVQWIYNQILPRLSPGVLVHLHDIFLPRDYPQQWVLEGWGWNELYLAHSFLLFNSAFEILFGARWMIEHHREELVAAFPEYPLHELGGGAALWMRRRGGTPMFGDR